MKETIDRVYVLFNKRTERYYRRSGTVTPSIWATAQGAKNAKSAARGDDWEVQELRVCQ